MLVNLESLKEDVKILFEAIEEGVYGTRSIVGDVSLQMDAHIRQLEKEVGHLTPNAVDAKSVADLDKEIDQFRTEQCGCCDHLL